MPTRQRVLTFLALPALSLAGCAGRQPQSGAPAASGVQPPASTAAVSPAPTPPPAAQNPSPMVERSRTHGRVAPHPLDTRVVRIGGLLPREVELHLPARLDARQPLPLLVHFLGPAYLAVDAARSAAPPGANAMAVAVVNLSPGSGAYERPFRAAATWPILLDSLASAASREAGASVTLGDVYLSAFSAGNGAVRAILALHAEAEPPSRAPAPGSRSAVATTPSARIRGVIILDGIHTGYLPERRVVADSGMLDPAPLLSLERFARRATAGEVHMIVTHSEVFPGTFASTTETANWLLDRLALDRRPVLAWGPNGMQQTSEARRGAFALLGFAGNSAPDHLDHLHALPTWLAMLVQR